jgi:hypothetical protein
MSGRNGTETRRSGRVTLRVPLKIFEPNTNKRFLVEEAYFAEGKPLGWTYRSKSTGESIPKTIAGQSGYRGKRGVANCLPGSHAPWRKTAKTGGHRVLETVAGILEHRIPLSRSMPGSGREPFQLGLYFERLLFL